MNDKEFELQRDQANRLWEHGLHEDGVFNERQNYFFVAESMLLVAYSTLASSVQPNLLITKVLASLGVFMTIFWIYVNRRQRFIVSHLQERARVVLPEYKVTFETRKHWRISSLTIMTYLIPSFIGIVWIIFLIAG